MAKDLEEGRWWCPSCSAETLMHRNPRHVRNPWVCIECGVDPDSGRQVQRPSEAVKPSALAFLEGKRDPREVKVLSENTPEYKRGPITSPTALKAYRRAQSRQARKVTK